MCLIIYAKNGRPTEEALENGATNHPDGAGIAWREGDFVHFKKDVSTEEIKRMAAELPLGYVIHFRWASVGGKDKSLIHPFPVRRDVPLKQEGKTKRVLFHNGHWADWNTVLVNHLTSRIQLPKGKWSDTRAIAFLVSVHGNNILNLLSKAGRFIVMSSTRTVALGSFVEENGVFYSNDSFKRLTRTKGTGVTTVYTPPVNSTTCDPCKVGATTGANVSAQSTFRLAASSTDVNVGDREALTPAEYDEVLAHYENKIAA